MADDRTMRRYRALYTLLLRMYPEPFRARFGTSMQQTFQDLCRERRASGARLHGFALGLFADTYAGILRERTAMIMPSRKKILRLALITASILAIPLVAMQFGEEVDWSGFDFAFAGVLVFTTGLAFEIIAGRSGTTSYRAATGLALASAFLLIWINLAVGIIGSENNPANGLYLGVLVVGILGSAIARLRPRGMARAMFATAGAQFLVPVIARIVWDPVVPGADLAYFIRVLFLNAFFVLLLLGSGVLYQRADEPASQDGAGAEASPAT